MARYETRWRVLVSNIQSAEVAEAIAAKLGAGAAAAGLAVDVESYGVQAAPDPCSCREGDSGAILESDPNCLSHGWS